MSLQGLAALAPKRSFEPTEMVGTPSSSFLSWLGRQCGRHPWPVLGAWLVLVSAALVFLPGFMQGLTGFPMDITGSESQRADAVMGQQFSDAFSEQDVIVFQSAADTVGSPGYQQVITNAIQNAKAVPGVVGVLGPLDPQAAGQVSADRHAALAVVALRGSATALQQQTAPSLMRAARSAATPDVSISVTGESEIRADMTSAETHGLEQAERVGIPVALVILLLAFGSLLAMGLPFTVAVAGIAVTFGALRLAMLFTSFDSLVETIVVMIGLGVGIDYALFITTRFREALGDHEPHQAVEIALSTAGKAIFFSGLTVVLALSALLLVNSEFFHDIAFAAMVTLAVMVLGALTLLPALLGLLGRRVNRLAPPFLRRTIERPDPDTGFWARWARAIMRRPVPWALLTTIVLLAVASPVTRMNLGLDLGTSDMRDRSSGQGVAVLQRYFSPGDVSPIRIVVKDPRGPLDDADLGVIARLTTALQATPEVAQVTSITSVLDQAVGAHSADALAAAAAQPGQRSLLGYLVNLDQDGNTTLLNVVSSAPIDASTALDLVRSIRGTLLPRLAAESGLTILVGGFSAQIVDWVDESNGKLAPVMGTVLLLAFLLLTVAFRSLLLPLKAIVMNLLSVGVAYGLLVLVFQQGAGARLFGFTPVGNLQVWLPLLTYVFLFGLSMDYEVFMVGRMREEWERTRANEMAVARGLQHSGRAVTSAAAIMVAVFLSFTAAGILEIKEVGFALGAAVFVDATIIRVLLVPAAMRLMGRWNWWIPRWLDGLLPRVAIGDKGMPSGIHDRPMGARPA